MARTTFTFTAPDGTLLKRVSDTKEYTHAIISQDEKTGKWGLCSCVGRPDLVAARLEEWGKGAPNVIAVAVNEPKTYVVVENAGQDAEKVVHTAGTHQAAFKWAKRYGRTAEAIRNAGFDVMRQLPDGSLTTEF